MELEIEKTFLEGTWWKYGLALVVAKLALWIALAYHWTPDLDWGLLLRNSGLIYGTFIVTAFLPFVAGRLQLRRLFWSSLIGFFLAETAYLFLALGGFGHVFELLPFVSYLQLYSTLFGLGVVIELGSFVYRKVTA